MDTFLRQHIEQIVSLTDEEFDLVRSYFTTKKLQKHQFLLQEGEFVPYDFLVEKGLLKAYYSMPNGKQHILHFAMENWWISDYQAFFSQSKATLTIDCIEPTTVWLLSYENREKLCAELHKIEHFFHKKLSRGYVALKQRVLSLISTDAQTRYQDFIRQYPTLLQRVPKSLIASYLGVSRETLSRLTK